MPEPNLPPLRLNVTGIQGETQVNVSTLKSSIPELPAETRELLKINYGLRDELIFQLVVSVLFFRFSALFRKRSQ